MDRYYKTNNEHRIYIVFDNINNDLLLIILKSKPLKIKLYKEVKDTTCK